jgi:hypothetical protein
MESTLTVCFEKPVFAYIPVLGEGARIAYFRFFSVLDRNTGMTGERKLREWICDDLSL